MRKPNLRRVVRGSGGALDDLAALAGAPLRIEDESGATMYGDAATTGESHPIETAGGPLGRVVGPRGADRVARVLAHLIEREVEKLALADETLGRYKELTLLYDISDKLSRVLDVDEVAELVAEQAKSFLQASSVSVLLADRRREALEPIATTDERDRARVLDATRGVVGRVLETGRAELAEDATCRDVGGDDTGICAVLCAPLRSGETVFGVLLATSHAQAAWTAGHLKLVTSLAGNAGAAISRAILHGERLREQALRHQISRFASPTLLDAAFATRPPSGAEPVAALFCDLGELARFADVALDSEALTALVHQATAVTLDVLMREGGTVQVSNGDMLIALFADARGLDEAAAAAARAARRIVRALDRRFGGLAAKSPGVAVTFAELPDARAADVFFSAVGAAANLQRRADGRILVDHRIAASLGDALPVVAGLSGGLDGGDATVYEVPA